MPHLVIRSQINTHPYNFCELYLIFSSIYYEATKLSLYEQSYKSLLYSPSVQTENNFSFLSSNELQIMTQSMTNKLFAENLNVNFCNYITVYTDGLVFPLSADYTFYISLLHISFTNKLPPSPRNVTPS